MIRRNVCGKSLSDRRWGIIHVGKQPLCQFWRLQFPHPGSNLSNAMYELSLLEIPGFHQIVGSFSSANEKQSCFRSNLDALICFPPLNYTMQDFYTKSWCRNTLENCTSLPSVICSKRTKEWKMTEWTRIANAHQQSIFWELVDWLFQFSFTLTSFNQKSIVLNQSLKLANDLPWHQRVKMPGSAGFIATVHSCRGWLIAEPKSRVGVFPAAAVQFGDREGTGPWLSWMCHFISTQTQRINMEFLCTWLQRRDWIECSSKKITCHCWIDC